METFDIAKHRGTFFKIVSTTDKSQFGVMTIPPGGDSGPEDVHDGDQIIHVMDGTADVVIDGATYRVPSGSIMTIPARTRHHIYNHGNDELFFLTAYAPPAY